MDLLAKFEVEIDILEPMYGNRPIENSKEYSYRSDTRYTVYPKNLVRQIFFISRHIGYFNCLYRKVLGDFRGNIELKTDKNYTNKIIDNIDYGRDESLLYIPIKLKSDIIDMIVLEIEKFGYKNNFKLDVTINLKADYRDMTEFEYLDEMIV